MVSVEGAPPDEPRASARRSVERGSVARFAAEALWALLALLTGVLIARHLGPDGKGTVSSIGYLVALIAPAATLGLGEAGVTLLRGRGWSLRDVVGGMLPLILAASALGAGLVVLFIVIQFGDRLSTLELSILGAALSVPWMALWYALSLLVEAEGGLVASSVIKIVTAATTTVATVVLVLQSELAVAGAVMATGIGFAAGALLTVAWLWRRHAPPQPRWNPSFRRQALPVGLPINASALLMGLSARADLLIVQVVKGATTAGLYSVALTFGQLVAYGPIAIAVASYPVAARLPDQAMADFVPQVSRMAAAASLLSAAVLLPTLPFVLPALFGSGFDGAVGTTMILVPAGVLFAVEWVTCRMWAAHGRGGLVARAFTISLGTMVAGDLLLVPEFGATGAAIAALVSSAVGAGAALVGHAGYSETPFALGQWVPHARDFRRILSLPARLLSGQGAGD
ncbi:MAG: polysaccharide biosynthesis protein [Solirubrobacterales bacterium]|nr:polysaccharide biosynthesis protein [Solirubrobacterales bacterium]